MGRSGVDARDTWTLRSGLSTAAPWVTPPGISGTRLSVVKMVRRSLSISKLSAFGEDVKYESLLAHDVRFAADHGRLHVRDL